MNGHSSLSLAERGSFWLYGLATGAALICCLLLSGMDYAFACDYLPNALLLPGGLALCGGIWALCGRLRLDTGKMRRLVLIIGLALLALRVFMVYNYYFYTDWDVYTIIQYARATASGQPLDDYFFEYFSTYPNNLPLVALYAGVMRAAAAVGADGYFAILAMQCVLYFTVGQMVYSAALRLTGSQRTALAAYAAQVLLVGLSPWVSIPYSDSIAVFFVTLLLWLYALQPKTGAGRLLRAAAFGFAAYAGYRIKPQCAIFAMAAVLLLAVRCLRKKKNSFSKWIGAAISRLIAGLLGMALAFATVSAMLTVFPMERMEPEKAFGMPHFFMMGLNKESGGVWRWADVEYSASFGTVAERTAGDMNRAMERIRDMGPSGLARQIARKTLTNFNDGTFCWGGEGRFFAEIQEEKIPFISYMIRKLYYGRDMTTHYYELFSNCEQALWLALLLLSLAAAWHRRAAALSIPALALFGLTLFETLFEARSRYFFCYAPVYALLAAAGLEVTIHAIETQIKKGRDSQ